MAGHGYEMCMEVHPSRMEFSQPFSKYVQSIFRKHPDLPMFKVIPPQGWKPRRSNFPDLSEVQISVPIRQHAFGTKGAYRCLFMEAKPMSVADFKQACDEEETIARGTPSARSRGNTVSGKSTQQPSNSIKTPDEFAVVERSFWNSVTVNPPLYGADTPVSFFDSKLSYGWNLGNLGDLLSTHNVDPIPGVTTPMTYFGMSRSFFGWHKEDADLYSINFLHWGAPKVWYCVAPSHRAKFERMAEGLFPELHKACPAFIRHKDIMISPALLRTYHIPYIQAQQQPGEFVVLNSAAYHSGFNTGFNCAEAVNFAMKDWVALGKIARPCRCSALGDGVRINMKLFDPTWVDPYASEEGSEDEETNATDSEDHPEQPAAAHHHVCSNRCKHKPLEGALMKLKGQSPSTVAAAGSKRKADAQHSNPAGTTRARGSNSPVTVAAACIKARLGSKAEDSGPAGKTVKVAPAAVVLLPKRVLAAQITAASLLARSRYMAARAKATTKKSSSSSVAGQLLAKGRALAAAVKAKEAATRVKLLTRVVVKAAAVAERLAEKAEQVKSIATAKAAAATAAAGPAGGAYVRGRGVQSSASKAGRTVIVNGSTGTSKHTSSSVAHRLVLGAAGRSAGTLSIHLSPSRSTNASRSDSMLAPPPPQIEKHLQRRRSALAYRDPAGGLHLQQQHLQETQPSTPRAVPLAIASRAALAHRQHLAVARSGVAVSGSRHAYDVEGCPSALVGQDRRGQRFFFLVQRLRKSVSGTSGKLSLRWLREGRDGLWRTIDGPSCEEFSAALVHIHTAQVAGTSQAASGWRLLTAHSSILGTRLASDEAGTSA